MRPSIKHFFTRRFCPLVGCVFLGFLFSGAVQNVELLSRNFVQTEESIPSNRDIVFVGLPGLRYPRLIGCEFKKITDIRVNCIESFSAQSKSFPRGAVSALKEKAREIGGDVVLYFNGPSSGIDAQVFRQQDGDCIPFLLFIDGDVKELDSKGCEYSILGPLIVSQFDSNSPGNTYWDILEGAFADSVRARSGEGLWVSESEGVITGRVLRFEDLACRGWIE